jgi:hypothetical protein
LKNSAAENRWHHFDEGSYDTNLITGALLWSDMKNISRLIISGKNPTELKTIVLQENILERNRSKTALNILSYLLQRLSFAPSSLLTLLAHGDSVASRQAAFLASLQSSRFLREFLADVVCDKLESFSPTLPSLFWEDFWNSCTAKDHTLQALRPKAVTELRSVLLKFLVEIEVLETSKARELKHIRFHPQTLQVLKSAELSWLTPYIRSFVR